VCLPLIRPTLLLSSQTAKAEARKQQEAATDSTEAKMGAEIAKIEASLAACLLGKATAEEEIALLQAEVARFREKEQSSEGMRSAWLHAAKHSAGVADQARQDRQAHTDVHLLASGTVVEVLWGARGPEVHVPGLKGATERRPVAEANSVARLPASSSLGSTRQSPPPQRGGQDLQDRGYTTSRPSTAGRTDRRVQR